MYLSIDQSTSSTTIFLFDKKLSLIKKISKQHKQIYRNKDWVEHDGEELDEKSSKKESFLIQCRGRRTQTCCPPPSTMIS